MSQLRELLQPEVGGHPALFIQESQMSPSPVLTRSLPCHQPCCWLKTCSLHGLKVAADNSGGFSVPSQDGDQLPELSTFHSTSTMTAVSLWNQSLQEGWDDSWTNLTQPVAAGLLLGTTYVLRGVRRTECWEISHNTGCKFG